MPMAEDNKALQGFFLSWSDKKLGIVAREDMLFRCYETSKIPKNQNRLNHVYLFHKCILIINALFYKSMFY